MCFAVRQLSQRQHSTQPYSWYPSRASVTAYSAHARSTTPPSAPASVSSWPSDWRHTSRPECPASGSVARHAASPNCADAQARRRARHGFWVCWSARATRCTGGAAPYGTPTVCRNYPFHFMSLPCSTVCCSTLADRPSGFPLHAVVGRRGPRRELDACGHGLSIASSAMSGCCGGRSDLGGGHAPPWKHDGW